MESNLTMSEKAYNDLMWYMVHYKRADGYSIRALRGCSFGLWVAMTFSARWAIHMLRLKIHDLLKLLFTIREKSRACSIINFDELPSYRYEPLFRDSEIRLLILHPGHKFDDISCELQIACLTDPPRYTALSYVWGDESVLFKVRCGKGQIQVRRNLFTALRRFRDESEVQTFFIDALCIDQSNIAERESQIQLMGDIYRKASETLIWLGESTNAERGWAGSALAFRRHFPEKRFNYHDTHEIQRDKETFRKTQAYRLLLGLDNTYTTVHGVSNGSIISRSWFTRKWVIQEVMNSKNPILVCGEESVPWAVVEDNVGYGVRYETHSFTRKTEKTTHRGVNNTFAITLLRNANGPIPRGLSELCQVFCNFECTDPRDHVIALLDIATDVRPGLLKADYSLSTTEMFQNYALWNIFERKSLEFLSMNTDPRNRPTWVPRFRSGLRRFTTARPSSLLGFRATLSSKPKAVADGSRLSLFCFPIGRLTDLGRPLPLPRTPSEFSNASTLNVVQEWQNARRKLYKGYYEECLEILNIPRNQCLVCTKKENSTATAYARYMAFIRALIQNQAYYGQSIDQTVIQVSEYLHEILCGSAAVFEALDSGFLVTAGNSEGKRLCLTTSGQVGYVPGDAEVGDMVCLFEGGSLPYIVRHCSDGEYIFIGDCFIDGAMYGEIYGEKLKSNETGQMLSLI